MQPRVESVSKWRIALYMLLVLENTSDLQFPVCILYGAESGEISTVPRVYILDAHRPQPELGGREVGALLIILCQKTLFNFLAMASTGIYMARFWRTITFLPVCASTRGPSLDWSFCCAAAIRPSRSGDFGFAFRSVGSLCVFLARPK